MHRRLAWRTAVCAGFLASTALAGTYPLVLPFAADPVRIDAQGKLELLDVERVDSSSPYQNPQGKLRLRLTADLSSRFQLVTDLTGTVGGTPRDPDGAGVYDFTHVRQDISPSLEIGEAYLDARASSVDLRVGLQKFAWGKLDALQPNDLLNPQKFYDPLLEDEIDRKNGLPAIAPTFYLPEPKSRLLPSEMRLTLVWAPIYVPYYFPDQDERWYPPLGRVPPESEVSILPPIALLNVTVKNTGRLRNARLPSRSPANSAYAARFSGLAAGADFSLYYFEGFDPAPVFDVSARGFVRGTPLAAELLDIRSEVEIFPSFHRIRAVGGDLAYKLFDATLRVEGAYVFDRAYPRAIRDIVAREELGLIDPIALLTGEEQSVAVSLTPVNVRRDGVEWGAGGDTFIGETFVLVQANQTAVLGNDVDLLISDLETRFALTVRRGFLDDRLKAELIGVYGLQGVYGVAHPRLTYSVNDYFDVRIGYVLIEGRGGSIVGQYKRNDEAYVRARYLF